MPLVINQQFEKWYLTPAEESVNIRTNWLLTTLGLLHITIERMEEDWKLQTKN